MTAGGPPWDQNRTPPPPPDGWWGPPPGYPPSFGGGGPLPRPRRQRTPGLWWKIPAIIVLVLVIIGQIGSLSSKSDSSTAVPTSDGSATTSVDYRVTSAQASVGTITWGTPNFGQAQVTGTAVPWSHEVPFPKPFSRVGLVLVAQNGPVNTTITCGIFVDGQQVAENESSGPDAVVTCSAS